MGSVHQRQGRGASQLQARAGAVGKRLPAPAMERAQPARRLCCTACGPPPPADAPTSACRRPTARRDGTRMLLTPESSVEAQKKLGADIIIPLDELPPYHTEQVGCIMQRSGSGRMQPRWLAVFGGSRGQLAAGRAAAVPCRAGGRARWLAGWCGGSSSLRAPRAAVQRPSAAPLAFSPTAASTHPSTSLTTLAAVGPGGQPTALAPLDGAQPAHAPGRRAPAGHVRRGARRAQPGAAPALHRLPHLPAL